MFGLMIVSTVVTITLVGLINMNIITNELNNASSIAVGQTQKYIKELKIDEFENNVNNAMTNEEYRNYFIERFNENVKKPNYYDLTDVEADYNHGLLYVSIKCKQYPKVKAKKLINIIEIDGEYGKGNRYKKGYSIWSSKRSYKKKEKVIYPIEWSDWQKNKPDSFYQIKEETKTINITNSLTGLTRNKEWPKEIFVLENDITSMSNITVDVYAYINTMSSATQTYWSPGLELYYYDGDQKVTITSRKEGKYSASKPLENDEKIILDNIHLSITEYKPTNGYQNKINSMRFKNSSITYQSLLYRYVTKWSDAYDVEEVNENIENKLYSYEMIYSRYIDKDFYETLASDSVWRSDEYKEVLNYYFDKYEKSI